MALSAGMTSVDVQNRGMLGRQGRARRGTSAAIALVTILAAVVDVRASAWAAGPVSVSVLDPTDDTHLDSTTPRGNRRSLLIDDRRIALLKFDLSAIPDSARVREAKLRLFLTRYAGPPGLVTVYEVLGPWDERTANDRTAPPISTDAVGTCTIAGGRT